MFWKKKNTGTFANASQISESRAQGAWSGHFNFEARKIEGELYEVIRESIPVADAAIDQLTSIDGFLKFEGDNLKLVDEVSDWAKQVKVNDLQSGLIALHENFTSEAFEQGFAVFEFVADKKRTDIVNFYVADSKRIRFKREKDGTGIWLRPKSGGSDVQIKGENIMYFGLKNENQNPYGVPLFRSCEEVAKILHTVQTALARQWERWGDPPLQLVYKTKQRDEKTLAERKKALMSTLTTAWRGKKEGKSSDFVYAIDTDSSIEINLIGANGTVLELQAPTRYLTEQIVAKSGLPAWMLGLHWSTTERLSDAEVSMLLANAKKRQAAKLPLFEKIVNQMLALRGVARKPKDVYPVFEDVNLHDIVKKAQARFLNAQADYYDSQYNNPAATAPDKITVTNHVKSCGCKEHNKLAGEPRSVSWPELDALEMRYFSNIVTNWEEMRKAVFSHLRLSDKDVFEFSPEDEAMLLLELDKFLGKYGTESELFDVYRAAIGAGYEEAARLNNRLPLFTVEANSSTYDELVKNGLKRVRERATQIVRDEIITEMRALVIAGYGPTDIARHLRKKFGDANKNWERLAATEITAAAERAKRDEWIAEGTEKVRFYPAPDACPVCIALAGIYSVESAPIAGTDTHPYCRCGNVPVNS